MNPDIKSLRYFALGVGLFILGLFEVILPNIFNDHHPIWPFIVVSILWVLGIAIPITLCPIYKLYIKLLFFLGKTNTAIIIGIIYYLILTPVAITMRLFGKNLIHHSLDRSLKTYRKQSVEIKSTSFYEPF